MKFIELPELSALSRSLHHRSSECSVYTRIEAYSCKSITREKKLFASLEHSYQEDAALPRSLPVNAEVYEDITPFGPLSHPSARKTLYLLIATLNVAFPDHSFSNLRPDAFVREPSGAHILNSLSTTLISLRSQPNSLGMSPPRSYASYPSPPDPDQSTHFFPSSQPTSSSPTSPFSHGPSAAPPIVTGTHPALYKVLDEVIKLSECEVFSYTPDITSDPHADDSEDDEAESDEESDFSDDASDDFDVKRDRYLPRDAGDYAFSFDDEDEFDDAVGLTPPSLTSSWILGDEDTTHAQPKPKPRPTNESDDSPLPTPEGSRILSRYNSGLKRRTRSPLLWSSHWFFYNKKLKRVLFISVWARKKSWHQSSSLSNVIHDQTSPMLRLDSHRTDSFRGWEGAAGAGRRALAIGLARSL